MAREQRWNLPPAGIYHVTARGVDRRAIFLDDDDRHFFLGLFELARRRQQWRVPAYCLMTNHFHILTETTVDGLSRGMNLLNGRFAQGFNARHNRTGHLFQGRFHARPIADDTHLEAACEYVLDNAVRAGLCGARADWPWLGGSLAGR